MKHDRMPVPVTFDYNGYEPRTDRYPVTCPDCGTRTAFRITGGKWPNQCPECRKMWYFDGVTPRAVRALNAERRARRRGVCPAATSRPAVRAQVARERKLKSERALDALLSVQRGD